jgi:hypothetical protein
MLKRQSFILLLVMPVLLTACKPEKQVPVRGSVTIDNTLYGDGPYYAFGFTFATASLTTTRETPQPDVVVLAETDLQGSFTGAFLNTSSFLPPYYLHGEYANADVAQAAFNALDSVPADITWIELGQPLAINQVWVFRTREEKYAKIRIIDISGEDRSGVAFAECTFEWAYQPDGSTIFPG